jgi:hypothetical protein
MFLLDSPDKWRAVWPFLTDAEIANYVADGTLIPELQAEAHPRTTGQQYSGNAAVRAVFLFQGEQVSPIGAPWFQVVMKPATIWKVAMLVAQEETEIAAKLIELNGGTMPNIRPPLPPAEPVPTEPETPEAGE